VDSSIQTAVIAAVSSLVVALATSAAAARIERGRIRAELRTEYMAEAAITGLLKHRDWKKRSFAQIQTRIRGFSDDELRRLLVRAGAVAFDSEDGREHWGLRSRNINDLE
jgi:hypothetical protein